VSCGKDFSCGKILEDIEKERGNGEVIYKITAEPDGKNEVRFYIAPDGRLLRKEKEED